MTLRWPIQCPQLLSCKLHLRECSTGSSGLRMWWGGAWGELWLIHHIPRLFHFCGLFFPKHKPSTAPCLFTASFSYHLPITWAFGSFMWCCLGYFTLYGVDLFPTCSLFTDLGKFSSCFQWPLRHITFIELIALLVHCKTNAYCTVHMHYACSCV